MSAAAGAELAGEVQEAALKQLWRQWHAAGAAVTSPSQTGIVVDPEVLILASLALMDHERRLADVLGSWVRVNSALVSIQRLRNLAPQFPSECLPRLSALAAIGLAAKDSRWRSLRSRGTPAELGARNNKQRSVEVPFGSWAALMLQLRRGMGVGAKADVLTYLLGINVSRTEWASVATIATETAYTAAAVRRAADDLAAASFLKVPGAGEGRTLQRMYAADPEHWVRLLRLSVHQPGWGYWRERFLFILAVLRWLTEAGKRRVSAYARDVEARELLTSHLGALRQDRVIDPKELSAAELNAEYLVQAARAMVSWINNRG